MLAHFLVTGLLFFGPILGQDPWPRRLGHGGRMLELLVPMPFHAFFGVAIMMYSTLITTTFAHPPAGWGIDPLADQGTAGSIAWSFSELPTVLVMIVVLGAWMGSEERKGRQLDRVAERTSDAELEAYNARLRALAARPEG
jgi:cytochrome c oxidase assembly factor CtaG